MEPTMRGKLPTNLVNRQATWTLALAAARPRRTGSQWFRSRVSDTGIHLSFEYRYLSSLQDIQFVALSKLRGALPPTCLAMGLIKPVTVCLTQYSASLSAAILRRLLRGLHQAVCCVHCPALPSWDLASLDFLSENGLKRLN